MAIHLTHGSKRRVPYREDAKILFQKQPVHVFVNGLPGHEKLNDCCNMLSAVDSYPAELKQLTSRHHNVP